MAYFGVADPHKGKTHVAAVILASDDVQDVDVEDHKGGEGVVGDSDLERVETIWQDAYYSTFFSDP